MKYKCKHCDGRGIYDFIFINKDKSKCKICSFCFGKGKLNYIENIFGFTKNYSHDIISKIIIRKLYTHEKFVKKLSRNHSVIVNTGNLKYKIIFEKIDNWKEMCWKIL